MREKVKKVLLECGIPMNQSGFLYILDVMEMFNENCAPITNMRTVYEIISKKRGHSVTDIMENITYSIEFGYKNCKTGAWGKYFGLMYRANGNYLANMWQKLKEEE